MVYIYSKYGVNIYKFIGSLTCLYKKRSVFPITKKGKLSGLLPQNIAWQHFVKKKRFFSEIVIKTK
jgi:hypothetical protein